MRKIIFFTGIFTCLFFQSGCVWFVEEEFIDDGKTSASYLMKD